MKETLRRWKWRLLPKRWYLPIQARRYARRREPEIGLLPFLVPPGSEAVDGGANQGVYSWFLAQLCRRVHAFEPNPTVYAYLSRAVPANVTTYRAALASRAGTARFHVPAGGGQLHHKQGSLLGASEATDGAAEHFEVPTVRLDDQTFTNLGFIKLDLEGGELDCLRGAEATLARHRPAVLAEVTGVAGSDPRELLAFMLERGYLALPLAGARISYRGTEPGRIPIERNCLFLPEEHPTAAPT